MRDFAAILGSSGIQGVEMDPSWKRQKVVRLGRIVAPLPGRVTP
jgi:hypothetical protein